MICNCGCGREARWLMTGEDYEGSPFFDDPACDSAASYCQEAATELGRRFTMRRIEANVEATDKTSSVGTDQVNKESP